MKDLMTTKNLTYVAIGLATAFVVYKVLENREKSAPFVKPKSATTDDTSSFCGCGA
jgi:H+/Cl- antiporter ClcA